MIQYWNESIFDNDAQALVNPVNCVGVMGGGLAKEFKERFPECYKPYVSMCETKNLYPGILHIVEVEQKIEYPKWIINFPTKQHYCSKSKLEYIEQGLDALVQAILRFKIQSIAIPKLGCGLGKLDWEKEVKPLVLAKLSPLVNNEVCTIIVCLGNDSKRDNKIR